MDEIIQVNDKQFRLYIPREEIQKEVKRVAGEIFRDFKDKDPIIIAELNGSFMFMTDLVRELDMDTEVAFVRYTSYEGMQSSGTVKRVMGFPESVKGRHVIIVEDIVETGISMDYTLEDLKKLEPASVSVCSFFFKPNCFKRSFKVDYIGREIEDEFIVGYGLDYNGRGRGYSDVYILCK